jgi:hypothetical protein
MCSSGLRLDGETKGKILSTADAGDDPSAWTARTYMMIKSNEQFSDIFLLIRLLCLPPFLWVLYKDP